MAAQASPENQRDAIIFIPGLGREFMPQDLGTIGAKIQGSLERNSKDVRTTFTLSSGVDEVYADAHRTQVRQLMVKEEAGEQRVLAELYTLDYHDNLRKTFEERTLLGKCLAVLAMLIGTIPAYLHAIAAPGKTRVEKTQIFFAGGILGLVAFYFLLLLLTLLGTLLPLEDISGQSPQNSVQTTVSGTAPTPARPKPPSETESVEPGKTAETVAAAEEESTEETEGDTVSAPDETKAQQPADAASENNQVAPGWKKLETLLPWMQTLVVVIAGLGAFSNRSLKLLVSELATEYVTAVGYIEAAERKQSINGQLTALIEHVSEQTPTYRRIHLMGFSFGSLIALDTLFPRHPPSLHLEQIDTLVTIGCPFDLVRTFWPRYFDQRKIGAIRAPEWINIYSRYDVLGSNFRDDEKEESAEERVTAKAFGMAETPEKTLTPQNLIYDLGIEVGRFPLLTVLTLKGFKAHGLYWEGSGKSELSCFDLVMPQLLLSEPDAAVISDSQSE